MTKTGSEAGEGRRWIDGDCVDRNWGSTRWKGRDSAGEWRKDKDTGSADNWERVSSSAEMTGERHWDGRR
jgi:hypothetical protein